ncbi:hypothetical protein DFS34DRAFT_596218 [Phlyctochytrium arcticum]|nr:hypothetical protein DFS34DRAFT_596218 [Phlyctochytrium arcticum]
MLLDIFVARIGPNQYKVNKPQSVTAYSQQVLLKSSVCGRWLSENYELTGKDNDCVVKQALYEEYADQNQGRKDTVGKIIFYKQVANFVKEIRSSKARMYSGLVKKNVE